MKGRSISEVIAALDENGTRASAGEDFARDVEEGINLPLDELIIGACALELGYAIATNNVRDFNRIPGLTIVPF